MTARAMAACVLGAAAVCGAAHGEERDQVSQFGITWKFDRMYQTGRFVNGDWWVLGPVKIVSVTPRPGKAPRGEKYSVRPRRYGARHVQKDDRMDKRSNTYRRCCNGHSWIGYALGARWMKAMRVWNHDAFFDYCDRWMSPGEVAIEKKRSRKTGRVGRASEAWITSMWKAYRKSAPRQKGAAKNTKWAWEGSYTGKWRKNPKGGWVPNPRPGGPVRSASR